MPCWRIGAWEMSIKVGQKTVCWNCHGSGEIYRKSSQRQQTVWRHDEIGEYQPNEMMVLSGGIDACPECAALSETEYEIYKMNEIEKLREMVAHAKHVFDLAEHNDSLGMDRIINQRRQEYYDLEEKLEAAEKAAHGS